MQSRSVHGISTHRMHCVTTQWRQPSTWRAAAALDTNGMYKLYIAHNNIFQHLFTSTQVDGVLRNWAALLLFKAQRCP